MLLTAGEGADDHKRLGAGGDSARQRRVGRLMGKILATGEEAHERAALMRDVVANRPAQHRIACFDGVKHRALGDWPGNVELLPRRRLARACVSGPAA